jgi:hypothetical protein
MLRDLEDEIVRLTGAEKVESPTRALPTFISRRVAHGTRYSRARSWIPREAHRLSADVLWVPLMGPEDFELDLFSQWDAQVGVKILYFFDTFEHHLPAIRRVLQAARWDVVSTAFDSARPLLEEATQRRWEVVRHGVTLERFRPAPIQERLIDFSAYGRRLEAVHEAVKRHSRKAGRYYDYTTAAQIQPGLDPREHYGHYAWHLSHSAFNFCWPLELTNPERVRSFSPVTCRWYEAAASGSVLVGRAPSDPAFHELFGSDAVIDVDVSGRGVEELCDELLRKKEDHLGRALARREAHAETWSWQGRVRQMMQAAGLPSEPVSGLERFA